MRSVGRMQFFSVKACNTYTMLQGLKLPTVEELLSWYVIVPLAGTVYFFLSIYKQRDSLIISVHYTWLQGICRIVGLLHICLAIYHAVWACLVKVNVRTQVLATTGPQGVGNHHQHCTAETINFNLLEEPVGRACPALDSSWQSFCLVLLWNNFQKAMNVL